MSKVTPQCKSLFPPTLIFLLVFTTSILTISASKVEDQQQKLLQQQQQQQQQLEQKPSPNSAIYPGSEGTDDPEGQRAAEYRRVDTPDDCVEEDGADDCQYVYVPRQIPDDNEGILEAYGGGPSVYGYYVPKQYFNNFDKRRLRFHKRRLRFIKKDRDAELTSSLEKRRLRFVKKNIEENNSNDNIHPTEKRRLRFIKKRTDGSNIDLHTIHRRATVPFADDADEILSPTEYLNNLITPVDKRGLSINNQQRLIGRLLESEIKNRERQRDIQRFLAAGKKRSLVPSADENLSPTEDLNNLVSPISKRGLSINNQQRLIGRLLESEIKKRERQRDIQRFLAAGK